MTHTIHPFPHMPSRASFTNLQSVTNYLSRHVDGIHALRHGKLECVTNVTLTANATSTVINDQRLAPQSVVIFDPLTANAAAELAAGTLYAAEANRGVTTWTITHANNAQTDREFHIAIIG